MVNTIRNLARQIWVCIDEKEPEDKDNKIALILEKISILSNQISNLGSELEVLKNNMKRFKK